MASFIVKQMIGSKLDSVKDFFEKELAGDKKEDASETPAAEDPEVIEARLEQERKRREKFAKMEADREKTRQGIRDKYNLKKNEDPLAAALAQSAEGSLTKPKKDPALLAIKTDDDEFDPVKMATNLFGNLKTSIAKIPFPWN